MEAKKEHSTLHILMLPWLAHGHISPFLELAKRLSHRNILVSLCSTPINLASVREELNHEAFPSINLVEIHLPTLPNLPPHLHTTKYLPSHLMPILKKAFDQSSPSFTSILKTLKPDLVIYDFIQPWAPKAAHQLNIPAILFLAPGAACASFFYHFLNSPTQEFPLMKSIGLPVLPPGIELDYLVNITKLIRKSVANGVSDADRFLDSLSLSSDIVLIKSFREIEAEYIDHLSLLTRKEMVPVGPLVSESSSSSLGSRKVMEWLDQKEKSSVLFVSFGSEYFMSEKEIEEIATGLEMSKVGFIWVVRFPDDEHEEDQAKKLPSGFVERIVGGDIGLILEGWAPQREILAHRSTGAFLTHCGWSSVMEGMRFGVPMIALPMQLDQPVNAKLVVQLGVGIEIHKDMGGFGMFRREELAKGIRDVVLDEEGLGVRKKAKEMSELMARKGDEEIDGLVEKMNLLCKSGVERKVIK